MLKLKSIDKLKENIAKKIINDFMIKMDSLGFTKEDIIRLLSEYFNKE